MDPTAVNWNVTIDDFDSILTYEDQAVWTTPDPSIPGFSSQSSPWLRGTYHQTETKGASISLNFTGPAIYVYGNNGPSYGSFEVEIDGVKSQFSAYQATSANSTLLYAASNLAYARHALTLRNVGAVADAGDKGGNAFTLDYIEATVQLAPAGATVSNKTFEETDPALKFSGVWGHNESPAFSGGTTTFTNADQASFTFSFQGSAVTVLGDKKNDHRFYSVVLDGGPAESFNGISGCGGAFGLTCEQQVPSIKYFASNLNGSTHTLTLTNHAGVNNSFFDLDSIVVAVPSTYQPRQLSDSSTPFVSSPSSPSSTGSGSTGGGTTTSKTASGNGSQNTSAATPMLSLSSSTLFLFLFFLGFQLRSSTRSR